MRSCEVGIVWPDIILSKEVREDCSEMCLFETKIYPEFRNIFKLAKWGWFLKTKDFPIRKFQWKKILVAFLFGGMMFSTPLLMTGLPAWELTYPPTSRHFWVDDCPNFPWKVGYLSVPWRVSHRLWLQEIPHGLFQIHQPSRDLCCGTDGILSGVFFWAGLHYITLPETKPASEYPWKLGLKCPKRKRQSKPNHWKSQGKEGGCLQWFFWVNSDLYSLIQVRL